MSKRQGNREMRKPKAEKAKAPVADAPVLALGKRPLEPLKTAKKSKT